MMEPRKRSFYTPPGCVLKTSAEIIKEARTAMATRPVNTKRPFTPQDPHRTLFGSRRSTNGRPPSSFSLRQIKFQDVENLKLPPLSSSGRSSKSPTLPWRLPQISRITSSLGNLPEEIEGEALNDMTGHSILRETHSSPKERTSTFDHALSKSKAPISGKSLFQRERFNKSKYQNRRKNSHYRVLNGNFNAQDNFPFNGIIKEIDEPTSEDQTKISSTNDKSSQLMFRKPTIGPLFVDAPVHEFDITVADNRINEKKVSQTEVDLSNKKTKSVQEILTSIGQLTAADRESLISLLEELYHVLKVEVRNKGSNKLHSQVIKTLYKFVESADDTLLLYIARVILTLRVVGQNLSAVSKLIFKVSRADKNDALFLEGDILELFVESLGRASPLDDAESCIYGYGALKFLTMNKELLLISLKLGILELMVLHLKIVNNARLELLTIPEQTSHALFQLTGALRNVASEEVTLKHFVQTGAIAELCTSMELFSADLDIISNIARTISIISTHEDCCNSIVMYENSFRTITKVLTKYPGRQDIVVRLGYALGNIVAKNDSARLKLFKEQGAMTVILNLLESYLDRDLELMTTPVPENKGVQSPEWGSDGSVEDVIIKMIRIVANMSMHPDVGIAMTCLPLEDSLDSAFAVDHHNARDGGKFIDMLLMVLRRKSIAESEELVMSTLSTLNNLSYYAEPSVAGDGPFAIRQIEIAQVLCTLLLTRNEDSMVESTRVLGNLTRSKDVRDYILEIGAIGQLVQCLDSSNKDLLFTTTGVMVNMMADWDKRLAFKESDGIQRLISVLSQSEGEWKVSNLVCQALWNFCIDSTHLYAALGIQPTNMLLAVLVDLLDEEQLFGVAEGADVPDTVADTVEYKSWEQFAIVATNLLEKIEQYLESINASGDNWDESYKSK